MKCQQHNQDFVLKPAGVTKAGKSYNSFWTCSGKNPDGSFCKNKPPKDYQPTNTQTFNAGLGQSGKAIDIDKREEKKNENISWLNAKNNATLIVSALLKEKEGVTPEWIKTSIEGLANWIHNLEPKEEPKIKVAPPVTERLPIIEQIVEDFGSKTADGETISLDSIPF